MAINLNAQDIQSRIYNSTSKNPIPYASIGIVGKTIGIVADENGFFSLKKSVLNQFLNDTLRISAIGFVTNQYIISNNHFLPNEIFLKEDSIQLNEVTVSNVKFEKEKVLGTNSESKSTITGWGRYGTGGERGLKISIGDKKKALLSEVKFFIRQSKFDEVIYRIHIRRLINDIPSNELIERNILVNSKTSVGWVAADIKEENIIVEGDIMVSIEVLKVKGSCNEAPCLIFSGQLLKGTLYAKEASEDYWKIKKRFSPSITVIALYPR